MSGHESSWKSCFDARNVAELINGHTNAERAARPQETRGNKEGMMLLPEQGLWRRMLFRGEMWGSFVFISAVRLISASSHTYT